MRQEIVVTLRLASPPTSFGLGPSYTCGQPAVSPNNCGVAGDRPVPADYDGDGTEDVVVFRGGAWLFYDFTTGAFDSMRSMWTGAPPRWTGGGRAYRLH